MSVAIIPARGGSTRIQRKNIRPFHGKPIIVYSIVAAMASKLFEQVYVSTDDKEIAGVAASHGAMVLERPEMLARNEVGTQEVMQHAVHVLRLRAGELVGCLYATAPLMRVQDLNRAEALLRFRPDTPYVYACSLKPLRDHDLPHDAGQFYLGLAGTFAAGIPLDADDVRKLVIPDAHICDINTPDDWTRAEQMYAAIHGVTA